MVARLRIDKSLDDFVCTFSVFVLRVTLIAILTDLALNYSLLILLFIGFVIKVSNYVVKFIHLFIDTGGDDKDVD